MSATRSQRLSPKLLAKVMDPRDVMAYPAG